MPISRIYIVTPCFWSPTQLSCLLGDKVEEWFRGKGIPLSRFKGIEATRQFFQSYMYEPHNVLIYMGHGCEVACCGEDVFSCNLLTIADIAYFTRPKLIVALPACRTARELGRVASRYKCAYIGCDRDFYAGFPEIEHNYFADWCDYIMELYKNLDKGVEEAVARYKERAYYYANLYYNKIGEWVNADWYYYSTKSNADGVVYYTPKGEEAPAFGEDILMAVRQFLTSFLAGTAVALVASTVAPVVAEYVRKELEKKKK